jgi:hypothetical protein
MILALHIILIPIALFGLWKAAWIGQLQVKLSHERRMRKFAIDQADELDAECLALTLLLIATGRAKADAIEQLQRTEVA